MSIQNRLVSVLEIDEEDQTTTKMTTPLRPKQPIPTLPCRLITPTKDVITWFPDGYISKKYKSGKSETWVPKEISMFETTIDMLTPTGHLHSIHYATETDPTELEGDMVNFHMIDNGEDSDIMCWEDECKCFEEGMISFEDCHENSRCETLGFHVGDGDCPVCGPEVEDEGGNWTPRGGCYCADEEY
jgi:hypothetical protein